MIRWSVIIPLNLGGDCKTRLASEIALPVRTGLVLAMAHHVIQTVRDFAAIDQISILSPEPPPFDAVHWLPDKRAGLNAELAMHLGRSPIVIFHGDLPLLNCADVKAMTTAAEKSGAAIAPDHLESGTNGLALFRPDGFTPAFGADSFSQHRYLLPHAALVRRPGLAHDIDTLADLDRLPNRGADMLETFTAVV